MIQVTANEQLPASDSGANIFMSIKNGNGTFVTQARLSNNGTGLSANVVNPALAKW